MSRIVTIRLECGATLLAERIEGVKSAAMSWVTPGGSADDPATALGRGAIWAELLMRGAGMRDSREQADAFDRLGCARSADVGTYFMRFAATFLGDRLADSLALMVDMVRCPRFDPESIEPARDLALQALESLKDEPQERAMLAARRRHYPDPINRSGLGTPEGLALLTRDELVHSWRETSGPNRSIIGVAGAIDPHVVGNQLNRLLHGWIGGSAEPKVSGVPVRGYEHEADPSNQVQIVVVHDAPSETKPESMLEKTVVSVLSGGMSGRLFSEVREKRGLCYSVSAGYRGERDFGGVTAYVGTTPEKAQQSLDVLMQELGRVQLPDGRVTRAEFDRAIVGMKSRLVFSGESTSARAAALVSDYHRLGRARTLAELASEVDGVTLDRLNTYLSERRLGRVTVQTVGPSALVMPTGAP